MVHDGGCPRMRASESCTPDVIRGRSGWAWSSHHTPDGIRGGLTVRPGRPPAAETLGISTLADSVVAWPRDSSAGQR